jgi:hypothetical protein
MQAPPPSLISIARRSLYAYMKANKKKGKLTFNGKNLCQKNKDI